MLKLFHSTGSCSLAARIALEEAGADYECVFVDTKAGDQRTAEFLALNPKGRVPALQTDRGVLTENPAILAWVAQSFPAARLAPLDDAWAFAQAQAFNSYLCATVHVARAHMYRAPRWADDPAAQTEMRRKAPEAIASGFQLIEDGMLAGPWVLGGTYSICDGYLFTLADWMDVDGMDIRNFPRVHDHRERMRVRPAVDRALAGGAALCLRGRKVLATKGSVRYRMGACARALTTRCFFRWGLAAPGRPFRLRVFAAGRTGDFLRRPTPQRNSAKRPQP